MPLSKSSPSSSAFDTFEIGSNLRYCPTIYSALVETGDLDNPSVLLLIREQGVRAVDGRSCFIPGRTR